MWQRMTGWIVPVGAVLLAGIGSSAAVYAADTGGRYAIKGFGQMPCSRFSEAREKREPAYLILGGWIEGYLTALNQTSAETYDLTSFESTDLLAGLIDRHCRKNPEHRFADVVRAMAQRLVEFRLQEYSEIVTVEVEDNKSTIYAETVRRMQRALTELGHYAGEIDGQYGEPMIVAVREYQGAIGTEPTGVPDQITLMRLFRTREPPAKE